MCRMSGCLFQVGVWAFGPTTSVDAVLAPIIPFLAVVSLLVRFVRVHRVDTHSTFASRGVQGLRRHRFRFCPAGDATPRMGSRRQPADWPLPCPAPPRLPACGCGSVPAARRSVRSHAAPWLVLRLNATPRRPPPVASHLGPPSARCYTHRCQPLRRRLSRTR